jgi:4-amino-4-deoxy-L-arabinose transferase-like glycosyltransferase
MSERLRLRLALAAILAVAAVLRGWDLGAGGVVIPYYLAGVRSQLAGWHNFFFNAFDPAGFVSLDKPPVAFWLQTASAKIFGFGTASVLLPQIVEGIGAVAVLYWLVRRRFGVAAGLLSALFLALNPVSAAVDRSNNTESCLVLVLLLAAWALIRAVETGRLRCAAARGNREDWTLALWAGWAAVYGAVFSAAGGLFHAYYLVVMAPALCALAGIGAVCLWRLYQGGGRAAVWLPLAILATALWQANIVQFYLGGVLAVGHVWLPAALIAGVAAACAALWRWPGQSLAWAAAALVILLAMPASWSVGTALVRRPAGFPTAQPPFLTAEAGQRRGRFAMVAGGLAGDPKLLAFLAESRRDERFLLAAVNARLAAPIIIATGDPVMALGGFSGRDPILGVDDFARLVAEGRVRFALVGEGSEGLRRVFGEGSQKPLVDWIRSNGRHVDPALWRSPAAESQQSRSAESVGAELYDLRPPADAGS